MASARRRTGLAHLRTNASARRGRIDQANARRNEPGAASSPGPRQGLAISSYDRCRYTVPGALQLIATGLPHPARAQRDRNGRCAQRCGCAQCPNAVCQGAGAPRLGPGPCALGSIRPGDFQKPQVHRAILECARHRRPLSRSRYRVPLTATLARSNGAPNGRARCAFLTRPARSKRQGAPSASDAPSAPKAVCQGAGAPRRRHHLPPMITLAVTACGW